MKRKTSNSPYPILYPSGVEYEKEQGYVQAHFDVIGEPRFTVNAAHNLVVDFKFDLTNPQLLSLVNEQLAKYYVNIECGHTYFRHAYVQSEKDFHLEINYGDIADSVEVFIGLVASKTISDFSSPYFDRRYGAAKFEIEKGDILAVGTGWTVELEETDASSNPYLYVSKDASDEHTELWTNGTGDNLIINLSSDLYNIYFNKKKIRKAELIALVMQPAIFAALQFEIERAQAERGEGEIKVDVDRRWLRKLDGLIGRVLCEEGIDWDINRVKIDSNRDKNTLAYAVAALLKRPLGKALEELNKK